MKLLSAKILLSALLTAVAVQLLSQDHASFVKIFDEIIADAEARHAIAEPIPVNIEEDSITCSQVRIVDIKNNVFGDKIIYGQKFKLHLDNLKGFNGESGYAHLNFTGRWENSKGATVVDYGNLSKKNKYDIQSGGAAKEFGRQFTIANPMFSGETYTFYASISDQKGGGKMELSFNMKVIPNPSMKIENQGLKCREVVFYRYSSKYRKYYYSSNAGLSPSIDNYLKLYHLEGCKVMDDGKVDIGVLVETVDPETHAVVDIIYDNPHYTTNVTDPANTQVLIDYFSIINSDSQKGRVTWTDNYTQKKMIVYIDFYKK